MYSILFIFTKIKYWSYGDFFLYNIFFNYTTFCPFTFLFSFLIEFFLFINIVHNLVFYKELRNNFKLFFYKYIFFLCFLTFILFFNFMVLNYSFLLGTHLLNNRYTLACKLISVILVLLILLISKKKILIRPRNVKLNEIPTIFSFLLIFICILLSTSDFFVMYLTVEGISLILYTLGTLMNLSLINLEAIIKYFLINNMASSFLL